MKYYKAGDVDLVCIKNFANGDVLSAIRNLPTIEVSEDAISRRGIKIRLGKRFSDEPNRIMEIVKETVDDAPSVIPKPKEGEWVVDDLIRKSDVLETYAELYDIFDDNKAIQEELHKVFDKINDIPTVEPNSSEKPNNSMERSRE